MSANDRETQLPAISDDPDRREAATTSVELLKGLADQINFQHDACMSNLNAALDHAFAAGKLLVEARAQVRHGEWTGWVAANFRFGLRTAQQYMLLAKKRSALRF
jgi:hypothetical protein